MSELKKYKLGDLGFFFGGVTSIKKEDYGHGTPFLPYKNVYKNSKVNVNELELMNVRPLDLERRNAVYGDIFFTASSETPDEVAMSSVLLDEVENLTFNGFCKRFRLNDFNTLLPEYARYLFRDISFRRQVYQLATGDIRFNISQESLANIEIEIPDTDTQKEIAQILTSLDDKIELNLQMNQTLEAMAQAIFKEWFVNFNFPGFDGELVDGLPKGWRMGSFEELTDIKTGKGLKRTEFKPDGIYPIIGANGELGRTDEYLLDDKLLLTGRVGTLGSIKISYGKKWYSDNVLIMKPYKYFYFSYFNLKAIDMNSLNRGSTQPLVTQTDLKNYLTLIPSEEILLLFEKTVNEIFEKIFFNDIQIQTLTQTRDTLLPKLMSGKMRLNCD